MLRFDYTTYIQKLTLAEIQGGDDENLFYFLYDKFKKKTTKL